MKNIAKPLSIFLLCFTYSNSLALVVYDPQNLTQSVKNYNQAVNQLKQNAAHYKKEIDHWREQINHIKKQNNTMKGQLARLCEHF